jgi:diguanylate cyclase (GGDEF)-like protein/PAS domain S-box-containing protein
VKSPKNPLVAPSAAARLVLVYAAFASLWILLSDKAVAWMFSDPASITLASMIKGWLFVGVTSLLLFGLIRRLLTQVLSASRAALQAQQERLRTQQLLDQIADSSPDAIFAKDLQGRYLMFNRETARVIGKSAQQALGLDDTALFPPEQAQGIRANDRQVIAQNQIRTYEETLNTVDGERTYLATKGPLRNAQGEVTGLFGISRDITERKQSDELIRIAATAFEVQDGTLVTDVGNVILRVNPAFSQITGYSAEEAVGQTPRLLKSGRQDAAFYAAMWDRIVRTGSWQGEIWNRRKDGEVYPCWLAIASVKNEQGRVTHYVGTFSDISSRKSAEDLILQLAFHDTLTRLANRRLLLERLQQALASSTRSGKYGALLLIDLDNFKTLNDSLGHEIGDLLLQQVAARLLGCVREGDTVARLGGDEFVLLLEDLSENIRESANHTEAVGEKILAALSQPYSLGVHLQHSTSSIGATLFCDQPGTLDELLKRADLAMYQAKAAGRNTLRFFEPEMQAVVLARAALEAGLHEALKQAQFVLYYQAQVQGEGQITGAEVLLRWLHPQRGLVPPGEFIPLAEETGMILPLGQWVLETACAQLGQWATCPELAGLSISVNVSARQFHQADFVDQVLAVLERSGANPQRLKLELTESLLVRDIEGVIAKMSALKVIGVSFSLDDFGTGYSSLSYLKRLPLGQLKIDQGFVRDILIDPNDAAIAKMVIVLAESMGLSVIAEGVETEAQRACLAEQGCHAYQGYLFSRPLPLAQFEALALRS